MEGLILRKCMFDVWKCMGFGGGGLFVFRLFGWLVVVVFLYFFFFCIYDCVGLT